MYTRKDVSDAHSYPEKYAAPRKHYDVTSIWTVRYWLKTASEPRKAAPEETVCGVRRQSGQRGGPDKQRTNHHGRRTHLRCDTSRLDGTYLPVVVSARPSPAELFSCPGARVTVEVVSALAMVTSRALEVSSPQWGQ